MENGRCSLRLFGAYLLPPTRSPRPQKGWVMAPPPHGFRSWTLEPVILAWLWALPFVDWPPCHKPSRLPRPPSGGRPLRAEDRSGHSWPGAGELGVQIPGSLDLASADSACCVQVTAPPWALLPHRSFNVAILSLPPPF